MLIVPLATAVKKGGQAPFPTTFSRKMVPVPLFSVLRPEVLEDTVTGVCPAILAV